MAQDIKLSLFEIKLLANNGNADTAFHLGMLYKEGREVTQDLNEAAYYYNIAARRGHEKAQLELACFFVNNLSIEQ